MQVNLYFMVHECVDLCYNFRGYDEWLLFKYIDISSRKGKENGGENMRKRLNGLLMIGVVVALSGCFGKTSPEEKVFDVLEETYTLEKPFIEQQDDIASLEKEEKEIFEEISSLPSDQMDEIQALAQQAIEGIEQREEYIKTERESMADSQEEFEKIYSLIEEIEDEEAKREVEQVVEIMEQRYEEYEELHRAYTNVLQLEKELYTLFENEETEKTEITDAIIHLNEMYEEIMEINATFNEYTAQYNEQKESFYKATELNVTFQES